MGTFFVYIVKSAFCAAMFYLFYRLLLSRETFHRFNRFALLGVMCLSGLLPLVELTVGQAEGAGLAATVMDEWWDMEQWEMASVADEDPLRNPSWREALVLLYAGGVLFFLFRSLWSMGRLLCFVRRSRRSRLSQGIWLVVHEDAFAPFSWMRYIVISRSDLEENGRDILLHETVHVRKRHSWDLLFAEIFVGLQWFNPAAWLLKRELQNVHEYEADEEVLCRGIDAKHYQMLLIKKAVGTRLYSVANSFTHSSLKKRITMMIRKKSNPWARAKYLYVLPLAAVAVAAFARPEISRPLEEISSVQVSDLNVIGEIGNAEKTVSEAESKIRVEGTVIDDSTGKPIAGVSVVIRNTTTGTLTDGNGKFVLDAPGNSVIVLSYIGKQTYSLVIPEKSESSLQKIAVKMKDEVTDLDELVVVGYDSEAPSASSSRPAPANKEEDDDLVFMVVEEMPEFPGGMGEMMKFLAQNIKYPAKAQEAKIQGRVIVQFVVKADGSTSDFEVKRSVSPLLDAEAVRVLSGMPKWKPGKQRGRAVNVKFTLPVTFRLDKPAEKKQQQDVVTAGGKDSSSFKVRSWTSLEKAPLVLVDGVEVSAGYMDRLSPDEIQNVAVLKDPVSTAQYGERGKNGVLLIVTKKK